MSESIYNNNNTSTTTTTIIANNKTSVENNNNNYTTTTIPSTTNSKSIKPKKTITKKSNTSQINRKKRKPLMDVLIDNYFKNKNRKDFTVERNKDVKLLNSDELNNLYNIIDSEEMFKRSIDKRKSISRSIEFSSMNNIKNSNTKSVNSKLSNRKGRYSIDKSDLNILNIASNNNNNTLKEYTSIKNNNSKTRKKTSTYNSLYYVPNKPSPVDRLSINNNNDDENLDSTPIIGVDEVITQLRKSSEKVSNTLTNSSSITKKIISEMKSINNDFNQTLLIDSINDKNNLLVNSQELIRSMSFH